MIEICNVEIVMVDSQFVDIKATNSHRQCAPVPSSLSAAISTVD